MLIKCPECNLQISDMAITCPHCGYPIKKDSNINQKPSTTKFKRLPNGFGQISKIKNQNLRNPYRAMVTTGFTEKGRPIVKMLKPQAYFKTYNEAYEALVKYNKDPYDTHSEITLRQLFDKWINDYFDPNEKTTHRQHQISYFAKLKEIEELKIAEIKPMFLKDYLEKLDLSADYKVRLKYLLNMLFDYAVSLQLVDKNTSRSFDLSTHIKKLRLSSVKNHFPFTDDEMKKLWNARKNPWVRNILIQCYMGWRPGELFLIKPENINLENSTIIGGSKSTAGRNRIVPIHHAIYPFIKYKLDHNEDFDNYKTYNSHFQNIVADLNLDPKHTPHDCRTTFVTLCKKYEVDEYAIKYIIGHQISDLTERVYTRRTVDWLKTEIEKIKADV